MFWMDRFGTLRTGLNPWIDTFYMQDRMDNLLSRFSTAASQGFPSVNVWTNEEKALVTTELPGIEPDAIEISIVGKTLTIRGSRDPEKVEDNVSYHSRERWYGKFTKTLEMPFPVNSAKVDAKFNRGILSIMLPRLEADKPKKISVKVE